jgi:hypothetical protein
MVPCTRGVAAGKAGTESIRVRKAGKPGVDVHGRHEQHSRQACLCGTHSRWNGRMACLRFDIQGTNLRQTSARMLCCALPSQRSAMPAKPLSNSAPAQSTPLCFPQLRLGSTHNRKATCLSSKRLPQPATHSRMNRRVCKSSRLPRGRACGACSAAGPHAARAPRLQPARQGRAGSGGCNSWEDAHPGKEPSCRADPGGSWP